jgi:hypothetical protein
MAEGVQRFVTAVIALCVIAIVIFYGSKALETNDAGSTLSASGTATSNAPPPLAILELKNLTDPSVPRYLICIAFGDRSFTAKARNPFTGTVVVYSGKKSAAGDNYNVNYAINGKEEEEVEFWKFTKTDDVWHGSIVAPNLDGGMDKKSIAFTRLNTECPW